MVVVRFVGTFFLGGGDSFDPSLQQLPISRGSTVCEGTLAATSMPYENSVSGFRYRHTRTASKAEI